MSRIVCHTQATRVALSAVMLALLALTLIPTVALAIADPDNLELQGVYVYEDCIEDGDVGVFIEYYINYASLPAETVTLSYLALFLDTTGLIISASSPYAYNDKGYGYGVAWIYFSADEASYYGLDADDWDRYDVRLAGNPTVPSGWTGDPPTTTRTVDSWQTTGDTGVLLGVRILQKASELSDEWGVDLVTTTSVGNRLSAEGETYFTNAIPDLRSMTSSVFSSGTQGPDYPGSDLDYTTSFGATMTDGTGTVTGSPIELDEGENTVTVTAVGTFVFSLEQGTVGNVTDGTGTVTGSPVDLVAGNTTVTVPDGGTGTLIVYVVLATTQTAITDTVIGTAFDLTTLAERFHMSRLWMSGIVWGIVTILICAAVYRKASEGQLASQSAGKITWIVFNVCFIGGALLGLLSFTIPILMFLASDLFIGYVLFFKTAYV